MWRLALILRTICILHTARGFALFYHALHQRWSPRGHILKSLALALASKVKSLALRPLVLKNWPVLGSRTALFFELLKFCEALENLFGKRFLWRSLEKFL